MADRPGSLAALARHCGEQGVNILGLQIFPGVDGVTDELVLRAPDGWRRGDVALLIHDAGGVDTTVGPCTEHALVDGPIQHLHALRRVAHDPGTLTEMLARLLDAEPTGSSRHDPTGDDTMLVTVGERRITLRRTTPFTATEHARAVAFAEIARELVDTEPADEPHEKTASVTGEPVVRLATFDDTAALTRMHQRCSSDALRRRYGSAPTQPDDRFSRRRLLAGGGALVAVSGGDVVGSRASGPPRPVWSRSRCWSRTVGSAAGSAPGCSWQPPGSPAAKAQTTWCSGGRTQDPAVTKLAFASGMRARARLERPGRRRDHQPRRAQTPRAGAGLARSAT